MPVALIVAAVLAAGLFVYTSLQPNADAGRQIAQHWCAECHQVTADQPRPQVRGAQPSPFATIAADTSKDDAYLRSFLTEIHLPMPTFRLTDDEKQDVVAYFHSLRR